METDKNEIENECNKTSILKSVLNRLKVDFERKRELQKITMWMIDKYLKRLGMQYNSMIRLKRKKRGWDNVSETKKAIEKAFD